MIKEKIGTGSISSGFEQVASWKNKDDISNVTPINLKVGDVFKVRQHLQSVDLITHTPTPGWCYLEYITSFIKNNMTGSKVSQKLVEEYGLTGVGLTRLDYKVVKCRDMLNSGAEVEITYRVDKIPTSEYIGVSPALIILLILVLAIILSALALVYEGILFLKQGGSTISYSILAVAAAIAIFASVSLVKALKSK